MMLTTKGRYAVMALLEIALQLTEEPTTLAEISLKQNISLKFLEQIFAKLKKANLVKSVKGPNGGYIINVQLDKIKIANIIDAVNENIEMTRCSKKTANSSCTPNKIKCNSHYLWQGLSDHIRNYLEAISIADMVEARVK